MTSLYLSRFSMHLCDPSGGVNNKSFIICLSASVPEASSIQLRWSQHHLHTLRRVHLRDSALIAPADSRLTFATAS